MKAHKNIVAYLLVLFAFSCSESVEPEPYTYSQVFTGASNKTWVVDQLYLREAGKDDERLVLSTCERDDRYTFYNNAERLFEVTNGQFSCTAEEESMLVSYNWSFSNANATLTMVMPHIFGNFIIPFFVKEVTNNTMELEIFLDEESTVSYVVYLEVVEEN